MYFVCLLTFCLCALSVPPGSLECLPRQELEQRLRSSMIMVEALVQQLATARTHGCPAGVVPSDLREKQVQTDHTELSQVRTQSEFLCLGRFIYFTMMTS